MSAITLGRFEDGAVARLDLDVLLATRAPLLDLWAARFKRGAAAMLRAVAAAPDGLTREALGEATGFASSGGTFADYLGALRRAGLVVTEGTQVCLAPALAEIPV